MGVRVFQCNQADKVHGENVESVVKTMSKIKSTADVGHTISPERGEFVNLFLIKDMAETRFPDFTNGEMKLGDERQVFAKSVVDAAIQVYVNGRVNDYLPVRLMGQWLRGVDRLLPDSTLSWPDRHRLIAELLYLSGMRLGGLPIKAMQFVGLRDDLPDGYQQWFSKAQEDNKLRSPADHVQKTLAVFGPNLTWSYEPLKSASIAQVHLDVTWERRAAVAKVQHPHVKDQYLADLDTMKYLGEYVNHHDEAKGAAVMLGALAEKLRPTVVAETDFTKEAENQRKLREFLQGIATVPEACLSMVLF